MLRSCALILAVGLVAGCRPEGHPSEQYSPLKPPPYFSADAGLPDDGLEDDAGAVQPPDAGIGDRLDGGDTTPLDAGAPDPLCEAQNPEPPCFEAGCVIEGAGLRMEIVHVESGYRALGVGPHGSILAVRLGDPWSRLWASCDGAKSWAWRGELDAELRHLVVLADGTFVAGTWKRGGHGLSRSTDSGRTWHTVLELGDRRMLQPESIAELGGEVFFAEYQATPGEDVVPVHLWASEDGGESWSVRFTFEGFRHAHGLLADPKTGALWAFMGDYTGGILRSYDSGHSWQTVLRSTEAVLVDAVATSKGLLFGTDALYRPLRPAIKLLHTDDSLETLAPLPGPSYSIHALSGEGFLLGTTRETGGDVYGWCDLSARLFGSADGRTWSELLALPRANPFVYCRVDPRWSLPAGEAIIDLENVKGLGTNGFLIVRVSGR